jgi:hypothetical protein
MTITPTTLTRASGAAAVAAGLAFMGVQIGHPELNATSITTTDVYVRDSFKVLMTALALVGFTGMYLSQIRRNGVLGLVGYVVLAAAYLGIMGTVFAAAYVLPEVAKTNPGYVNDVLAADTGRGTVHGDIGGLQTVIQLKGAAYLVGGLLFGIALYRARVLARWAAVLLAVGGAVSVLLSLMPDAFFRVLAFPNAIAMIGLCYSLWRTTPTSTEVQPSAITIPGSRAPSPSEDSAITTAAAPPID